MTRCATLILALAAATLGPAARAQNVQLNPGLWEHGFSMKSSDGKMEGAMQQMQERLAAMPPEQRKMMEDMMARQGLGIGPQGNTVKVCLTKEDIERGSTPQEPGCTQTGRRTGNVWSMSFQCKGPPPSSGEGQLTWASPTAYSGNFTVRTTQDGKPHVMQMAQTGKWLAASCGNVRPISAR